MSSCFIHSGDFAEGSIAYPLFGPNDQGQPEESDVEIDLSAGELESSASALDRFFRDMMQIPLFDLGEETEIALSMHASKINTELWTYYRNKLVEHNIRLVFWTVRHSFSHIKVAMEDLVQWGILGLIDAAGKFDPAKGKLSTYAPWYIRQSIYRHLTNTNSLIRLPVHVRDDVSTLLKCKASFQKQYQRVPSDEELVNLTGFSTRKLLQLERCMVLEPVSFSNLLFTNGQTSHFDSEYDERIANIVIESGEVSQDGIVIANQKLSEKTAAVNKFLIAVTRLRFMRNGKYKRAFFLHFGLDRSGFERRSLGETAVLLGVTRERVRQLVKMVWNRMACRTDVSRFSERTFLNQLQQLLILGEIAGQDESEIYARVCAGPIADFIRRELLTGTIGVAR